MEKHKILGIISILLFIVGWILYAKVGVILSLIIEILALVLAIISEKGGKNTFATIGIIGAILLIIMMIVVLLGSGILSNTGNDALINKAREIQQNK